MSNQETLPSQTDIFKGYTALLASKTLFGPKFAHLPPLLANLQKLQNIQGFVLFGSTRSGLFDKDSDVDLICLRDGERTQESRWINGTHVDLHYLSGFELEKQIQRREGRNNNLYLNAMSSGVVLTDDKDCLQSLKQKAVNIIKVGPQPLSASETAALRMIFERRYFN